MTRRLIALTAAAILPSFAAAAWEFSIWPTGDLADLRSHEQEASYTSRNDADKTVAWISKAVKRPTVDKHNDRCAKIPSYMDGAICERMCGGGLTSTPVKWDVKWRPAGFGDHTPWRECNDANKCRGFGAEYYAGPQRGCGHIAFWGAAPYGEPELDFKITVTLQ